MKKEEDEFVYEAFISYRSTDRKIAEKLLGQLQRWKTPRDLVGKVGRSGPIPRRLGKLCLDREDFPTSQYIETLIASRLSQSRNLVVLCSPPAADERSWVGREIELFKKLRPDGEIHSIIAYGEPPHCFPKQLINDGLLPLAADMRPVGDGPKASAVKLISGLLGLGFEQLWRHNQRRNRNTFIARTCALAAISLLGILIAYSWRSELRLDIQEERARSIIEERQSKVVNGQFHADNYIVRLREDLNKDNRTDFLVAYRHSYFCGSGGCSMDAWISEGNKYSEVPVYGSELAGGTNYTASDLNSRGVRSILYTTIMKNKANDPLHAAMSFDGEAYRVTGYVYCGRVLLEYCQEPNKLVLPVIPENNSKRFVIKKDSLLYNTPELKDHFTISEVYGDNLPYLIAWTDKPRLFIARQYVFTNGGKELRYMFVRGNDISIHSTPSGE